MFMISAEFRPLNFIRKPDIIKVHEASKRLE
jgi:hypothetical protein